MKRNLWRDFLMWLSGLVLLPHRLRPSLVRWAGHDVGKGVRMFAEVVIDGPGRVSLGDRVFVNRGVYIDAQANVAIGADCQIADHVRILTGSHSISDGARTAGPLTAAPVQIGAGCWLGSGSVLLPGVEVGERCVVGAGAVVTKDIVGPGIFAGIPARQIGSLPAASGADDEP